VAQVVSLLGDWFEYIAVQTLVFELTQSGLAAGLAIITSTLPSFFLIPLAGSIADRFDRRKIMILTDVARAGLALSLLFVRTADQIPLVYLFTALSVLFASFFNPASNAAIPNLVRRDQLLTANALSAATWGAMLAIGTSIGGLTIGAVGRDIAFVLNALSFLVSAAVLFTVRRPFNEHRATARRGLNPFGDFAEGFKFAWQRPQVFLLMFVKSGAALGGGVILLLTVFSFEVFRTGAAGMGLLQAARGLGILVGPLVITRLAGGQITRAQRLIIAGSFLIGGSYILFGLAPALLVAMVFVFTAHMGWGSNWVLSATLIQRLTPDFVRGRIFSMDLGLLTLALALSTFLTGVAVDRYDPHVVAIGLGATFIAFGVLWGSALFLMRRRAREKWEEGSLAPPHAPEPHPVERRTAGESAEEFGPVAE
jgi:MFS family permease